MCFAFAFFVFHQQGATKSNNGPLIIKSDVGQVHRTCSRVADNGNTFSKYYIYLINNVICHKKNTIQTLTLFTVFHVSLGYFIIKIPYVTAVVYTTRIHFNFTTQTTYSFQCFNWNLNEAQMYTSLVSNGKPFYCFT